MIFMRIGVRQAAFFLCATIKSQACAVKTLGIFKVKKTLLSYFNYVKEYNIYEVSSRSFSTVDVDGSKVVKSELISAVAS